MWLCSLLTLYVVLSVLACKADQADLKVLKSFNKSRHRKLREVLQRHKQLYPLLTAIMVKPNQFVTDEPLVNEENDTSKDPGKSILSNTALSSLATDRQDTSEILTADVGTLNLYRQSMLRDYGLRNSLVDFTLNLEKLRPDDKFRFKVYACCVLMKQKTKWEVFVLEQQVANLIFYFDENFSRGKRLTVFIAALLGQLFIAGLFHDTSGARDEEDDTSLGDALIEFSWYDFWVAVISAVLVLPFFFVMNRLFPKLKISLKLPSEEQAKLAKRNTVKQAVAYGVAWSFMAITCYEITILSIQFNSSANYKWFLSFATSTLYDLSVQTNLRVLVQLVKNARSRIKFSFKS
jgi:hypothetical protein